MQSKIVAVRIAWGAGSLSDFTAKRLQNLAQGGGLAEPWVSVVKAQL
jgi:hypothetical protein